jgi:hypothetical protein
MQNLDKSVGNGIYKGAAFFLSKPIDRSYKVVIDWMTIYIVSAYKQISLY